MHLKSITAKGITSIPERSRLSFEPGGSVIARPNGSRKSDVRDAVRCAMGEQWPLAVRGQAMQGVIFSGGRGLQESQAAEVELTLDDSDDSVELGLSEISILRRL